MGCLRTRLSAALSTESRGILVPMSWVRRALSLLVCVSALALCWNGPAAWAFSVETPLVVTDTRGSDGAITVETSEWKLVFSDRFNGGIHQWYDLAFDPGQTDNLTTASFSGFYSTGTLFDYDVYLGAAGAPFYEFATTIGTNNDPGALTFSILEDTPARVRILQSGHPRLNNGLGPPGDPFVELEYIDVSTIWTIYPTGKVAIHFTADVNPAGTVVDTGPGGGGKGINAIGCCGSENVLNATGGADFEQEFTWAGDTIESVAGGWGPVQIIGRNSPTQLIVAAPLPPGSNLDYVIRRSAIALETISTHADGDPSIINQCSDPGTSRWDGGSNGDPVWTLPAGDGCSTLFREQLGHPPISDDVILAHWTVDRGAGAMLAFFEKWDGVSGGFYNDLGFTDISYTQLGKLTSVFEPHHRHFMAHIGSSAATLAPQIKSVADALPYGEDYRAPFAEALVGSLAVGSEIVGSGFDPGKASYEIEANLSCEAVIRFDSSSVGRAGLQYKAPVIELSEYHVDDADVVVERSTDGGATFTSLAANKYNLTGNLQEASLGAGRRVFQYLDSIPASAGGASAWAFRFAGASGCSSPPTTTTTTLPLPICGGSPLVGCKGALSGKSQLQIKLKASDPSKDQVRFKYKKGVATLATEFGDPVGGSPLYRLCVWDSSVTPQPLLEAQITPGGACGTRPCWKTKPGKSHQYKNKAGNSDGVQQVKIKADGSPDRTQIQVKARGLSLPAPTLPLTTTVTAQFIVDDGGIACWEVPLSVAIKNDASQFKAKGP